MELKEYKKRSHEYTAKASEIARYMMLAGIGIIWIIRTDRESLTLSNPELLWPLIIMTITIVVDFMQYLIGGIIWIKFYRHHEKNNVSDNAQVVSHKLWRKNVIYFMYYSKFVLTILAYVLIIKALFNYY